MSDGGGGIFPFMVRRLITLVVLIGGIATWMLTSRTEDPTVKVEGAGSDVGSEVGSEQPHAVGKDALTRVGKFERSVEFQSEEFPQSIVISLGELPSDGTLEGLIRCKNLTKQSIDLSRAVTTCGCMVVNGTALQPAQQGVLSFSLRSSNLFAPRGEVAVYLPSGKGVVRCITFNWSHAPAGVLVGEQLECSSSDLVLIDIFGLVPSGVPTDRGFPTELPAPLPEVEMLCVDWVWRSIPAVWRAEPLSPRKLGSTIAVWSGHLEVCRTDLIDSAAASFVAMPTASTRVQVRIHAPGWSRSQVVELDTARAVDLSHSSVTLK